MFWRKAIISIRKGLLAKLTGWIDYREDYQYGLSAAKFTAESCTRDTVMAPF
jgi:hypothetical protein